MSRILPNTSVPALDLHLVDGSSWSLADQTPDHFTFLFFYRGLHCPICGQQLRSLEKDLEEFHALGIHPIAISMDPLERAQQSHTEWKLERLPQAYGLTQEQATAWGLYFSRSFKEGEPELFSEPALHIVRPDGTLYASSIQTMPFTRPTNKELLMGFKYIIENGYPARGDAWPL